MSRHFKPLTMLTISLLLLTGSASVHAQDSELVDEATFSNYESGLKALDTESYSVAVKMFSTLAKQTPDDAYIHFMLAKSYAGQGKTLLSEKSNKKAVKLDPNLFEAYAPLALACMNAGNVSDAKGLLAKLERREKRCKSKCPAGLAGAVQGVRLAVNGEK